MQVCILYAGRSNESPKLRSIAEGLAKGISAQGHMPTVINMNADQERLSIYDYVIIGTEPASMFSAKVPERISRYLAQAGAVSGKRCMAFVSGGLRKNKTLLNLMKAMEGEGMMLRTSEVITKADEALAIGKRLNVERNI